jgi:large subunit ribosomal protein L21
VIRVTEILTDVKAPTVGPRPKREKKIETAPVDGDEAPAKVVKKAPAKKAVAKAPAKAAAPKTAAKKAAPKAKSDKE